MYIRTVSSLSKKTALPSSFSVSPTCFVYHCRLIRFRCLVRCPCPCSFSPMLCIVQCPVGTPSLSSFLKRSKDLTLNSDFTELVHGVSSRHSSQGGKTEHTINCPFLIAEYCIQRLCLIRSKILRCSKIVVCTWIPKRQKSNIRDGNCIGRPW